MAQVAPEYEDLDEFSDLAEKLVKRHESKFSGIDLTVIKAMAITNKERKETQTKLYEIIAVKPPLRPNHCKFAFFVIVYQSDWDVMDKKHKLLLIAQTLHSISLDENGEMEEGGVNTFDYKDFAPMLRTFGPDYLVKDNVPDLLEDEIKWVD